MEVYVEQLVKREITQSENRMKTILGVVLSATIFATIGTASVYADTTEAEKEGINFSQLLQEALQKKLGLLK